MSDWIKAINPMAPITTEGEALRAARASAIGVALGAAVGIVGVVQMVLKKDEIIAAATAATNDPAMAGMGATMAQLALYFAIGLVVIQAILAFVQWAKPNIIIPILFAVLVAGGLVLGLMGQMMATGQTPSVPVWQTVLSVVIAFVQLTLHIAGARGASRLDKLRFAAAQDY